MSVASRPSSSDDYKADYWRRRATQLAIALESLRQRVSSVQVITEDIQTMWGTSFTNTQEWKDLCQRGRTATIAARAQRSRVRKFAYEDRDTLRINSALAAACPDNHKQQLQEVVDYLRMLEAMGY